MKRFGCDFFWHWVGGVPWREGAREDCWCDYDRSVYSIFAINKKNRNIIWNNTFYVSYKCQLSLYDSRN